MELIKWALPFLLIQSAYTFTLNNGAAASFENDRVSINVANVDCTNLGSGISYNELLDLAYEGAIRFWNTVPTSRLELTKGGIRSVSGVFGTDQICSNNDTNNCTPNEALKVSADILISCNTNANNFSNSAHVLAVGAPNNISGDSINGALILINDQASNSFASLSRDEKIAVIAHEIGHAVGLGHSQYDRNLMYYSSVSTRFQLGEDDSDGVTWLYPREQPISGCGLIDLNPHDGPPTDKGAPVIFFIFAFVLGLLLSFAPKFINSKKSITA